MGNQAFKLSHKEKGLCTSCSRVADYPHILCTMHRELENKRLIKPHKLQIIKRKENNLCSRCGYPLTDDDNGFLTCVNCREGHDRGWN